MLQSPAILLAGILALVELVVAALLDFFKREPRYRYDIFSRSISQRMFWTYGGLTGVQWALVALMQIVVLIPEAGWPLFGLCFVGKMLLLQKDFVKRRTDVLNVMFRLAQYQFLVAAVLLVGVSFYVHRPTAPTTTAPSPRSEPGPGASDRAPSSVKDLLKD
ncbi:MAG TPA: hypothetical protein VF669_07660 [Tepidisphaeraceae bacterium]